MCRPQVSETPSITETAVVADFEKVGDGFASSFAALETLSRALAGAATTEEAADTLIDRGLLPLGANVGVLCVLSPDSKELIVLRAVGCEPDVLPPYVRFPADSDLPLAEVIRTSEPLFLETHAERHQCYPQFAAIRARGGDDKGAMVILPLRAGERLLGGLGWIWPEDRAFGPDERAFLQTIANLGAGALLRTLAAESRLPSRAPGAPPRFYYRPPKDDSTPPEEFFRQVTAAAPAILYVYDLQERKSVFQNRPLGTLLGYSAEETAAFGGGEWRALMHPEDQERFPAHRERMHTLRVEESLLFAYRMRHRDGRWRWLLSRDVPMRFAPSGEPRYIVGTTTDITERKQAEEALRESEERLRQAMEAAQAGSWRVVPATGEFLASERALELHGLPPGLPMTHERALACVHPEDRSAVMMALQRTVETGVPFRLELRAPQRDGTMRWLASQAERRNIGGQIQVAGLVQDITERKLQEEALRASEERLNLLYEAGRLLSETLEPETIYARLRELVARVMPLDGLVVSAYDSEPQAIRCEHLWTEGKRIDPAEFPPLPLTPEGGMQSEVILTGEPRLFGDVRERVRDPRGTFYEITGEEPYLQPADQSPVGVESALMVPMRLEGRVTGVVQVMSDTPGAYFKGDLERLIDIVAQLAVALQNARLYQEVAQEVTERKEAEQALHVSEERLRLALNAMRGLIFDWDRETDLVYRSEGLLSLVGYAPEEVPPTADWWENMMHSDDRERMQAEVARIHASAISYQGEYRVRHRDGHYVPVLEQGQIMRDGDGKIRRIIGITIDLTQQKKAQEQLRKSEERFRIAENASHSFVYDYDVVTGLEERSEGFTKILGYRQEEMPQGGAMWETIMHPEDVARVRAIMEEAAASPSHGARVEYRLRHKNGAWLWVMDESVVIRDEQGAIRHIVGSIVDISAQKRAQQEIGDLNLRLQRAVAETHHRVKNNLQMLSALVEIQLPEVRESATVTALTRMGQHIRTLASLHDLLTLDSRAEAGREIISLKSTLEKIVPLLEDTTGIRKIRFRAEDVQAPLQQGSSFVMLVNELVSNAFKHGKGDVDVCLARVSEADARGTPSMAELEVCDDGPGFPPGFDPKKAANTGLELIDSLGRWDLRGRIVYANRPEGGARVRVTFPIPMP